jgi:hypothetical protein
VERFTNGHDKLPRDFLGFYTMQNTRILCHVNETCYTRVMSYVDEITVRTQKTHVSVTCRSLGGPPPLGYGPGLDYITGFAVSVVCRLQYCCHLQSRYASVRNKIGIEKFHYPAKGGGAWHKAPPPPKYATGSQLLPFSYKA